MSTRAYVLDPDPVERHWIEAALAPCVDAVTVLVDSAALFTGAPVGVETLLITSVEANDTSTVQLVQDLRGRGMHLPVIVLGSHNAFRTAVHIAQLDATDFLERPVSARQLCAAVTRLLARQP